jgi:hypothetical protein
MRRWVAIAAITSLMVGALSTGASAGGRHCADVTIRARAFFIEDKWSAKSYRIGDTIKVNILITRTSDKDPVTDEGQELPGDRPVREPAEGVNLGVGVFVGDVYLDGGGLTDANGKATVKILVQDYVKPGVADTRIYAYKRYLDDIPARCVILEEWGMKEQPGTFKITR